ncbi:uncharacterized protein [Antedon mediterranea]|uniref:uncharacterized protein n=1 Tax=Antedon mediterranea TaxID=105859 RepID=UPI003AF59109
MNSKGISNFLHPIGLMQYEEIFKIKGYDIESDFPNLDEDDLNQMKIFNKEHRRLILEAAQVYQPSEYFEVFSWLRRNGLDYYFTNFVNSDIDTLRSASDLEVNENTLHDLEIHLPSHRKRLREAVSNLRKKHKTDYEKVITIGYWGRPNELKDSPHDFLCVRATLKSRHPGDPKFEDLEFMVDSGSDVVTLKPELFARLHLDYIAPIKSRGVHTTVDKDLYKAFLVFGQDTEIEVEAITEKYNSVGNRVIQQFRHMIGGQSHIWLQAESSVSSDSGDDNSNSETRRRRPLFDEASTSHDIGEPSEAQDDVQAQSTKLIPQAKSTSEEKQESSTVVSIPQ